MNRFFYKYLKIYFFSLLLFICLFVYTHQAWAWESYIAKSYTMYVKEITPDNLLIATTQSRSSGQLFSINFYGIGIPMANQPFADEAHRYLMGLLPKDAKITVTVVGNEEEGILNALVQHKDHSVNNSLIEQGYAWVERSSCKAFFCRRWYIQEHISVKEKRGIWSLNTTKAPWQWSIK